MQNRLFTPSVNRIITCFFSLAVSSIDLLQLIIHSNTCSVLWNSIIFTLFIASKTTALVCNWCFCVGFWCKPPAPNAYHLVFLLTKSAATSFSASILLGLKSGTYFQKPLQLLYQFSCRFCLIAYVNCSWSCHCNTKELNASTLIMFRTGFNALKSFEPWSLALN
jgi:hypothetical protein